MTEKTDTAAFNFLLKDNESKDRTKDIKFYELRMSEYIFENKNTKISQVIFSIRSKTFDIKVWRPWKYSNDLCVKCEKYQETMEHFVTCVEYGKEIEIGWKDILEEDTEKQIAIAQFIDVRYNVRKKILEKQEGGQASDTGSYAPGGTL